jgi:ADP-ribosylglycohydrolase
MRTAPIGLFNADHAEYRRIAATLDSAITHFDPRCLIASAAFDAALAAAVREGAGAEEMVEAARVEIAEARAFLAPRFEGDEPLLDGAAAALQRDLTAAANDDPALYGPELHLLEQAGFVRVAFRLAFWELLHAPDFESALVDVVNRGGDADTNGAITGALLGARHGEEAIPVQWRAVVLEARPAATGAHSRPYHALTLLELAR